MTKSKSSLFSQCIVRNRRFNQVVRSLLLQPGPSNTQVKAKSCSGHWLFVVRRTSKKWWGSWASCLTFQPTCLSLFLHVRMQEARENASTILKHRQGKCIIITWINLCWIQPQARILVKILCLIFWRPSKPLTTSWIPPISAIEGSSPHLASDMQTPVFHSAVLSQEVQAGGRVGFWAALPACSLPLCGDILTATSSLIYVALCRLCTAPFTT